MALQPVNRRSVPEDVFEQIVTEVLSGENRGGWAFLNRPTATGNNQTAP